MNYRLDAAPTANKQLKALPPAIADGIRRVLHDLAADPGATRFDLKRLRSIRATPPTLRLRVGAYRVLLKIDHAEKHVHVLRIGHRRDVYRGLDRLD